MRFTTIKTNEQILFKSIKEHQKQPGLAGPGFWRKDKYTERSPTFAFTRSLGSFVVFGGLEKEAKQKVTGGLAIKQLRLMRQKSEEERNVKKSQKFCKQFSLRCLLTHHLSVDETPKHQTESSTGRLKS